MAWRCNCNDTVFDGIRVARPSFGEGMARLLDFGNTLCEYHYASTRDPWREDAAALRSDWVRIGGDFWRAAARLADCECPYR